MAKQPYIPLYIGDWIQDTDCLSIDAEGAWLRIIFKCWKNAGVFTASEQVLARVCKVDTTKFASILLEWQQNGICQIESLPDGQIKITSRRIKREKEISAVRSEIGSKGGSKTQAKGKAKGQAKVKQNTDNDIDNDNEVENEIEFKYEPKIENSEPVLIPLDKAVITGEILNDEVFMEALQMAHRGKNLKQAWEECWIHHSTGLSPPRDLATWKQKFNGWLSNKGHERTSKTNKQHQRTSSLAEGFAKRYGNNSGSNGGG